MKELDLLKIMNRPIPRYTSYPTHPQFSPIKATLYEKALKEFDETDKPLSLYIHIPFCRRMCLFCACSVTLNRSEEKQENYLQDLFREIELISSYFKRPHLVRQLHLGGGTPTSLTEKQFDRLLDKLSLHFSIDWEGEISIEVDPRTVFADKGGKLAHLRKIGFNRVSFGVQDTSPIVQEAVHRRQSYEMSYDTFMKAKELRFSGINIDLIYGLPFQTVKSFAKTIEQIGEMRPDRIALFSYAKVPWLKPHQKAIAEDSLPSLEEKFKIYTQARKTLKEKGYINIGMDHFSVEEDPLVKAYREGTLYRNFQGYTIKMAEDMIGLGNSSIGFLQNHYIQNQKSVESYGEEVKKGKLPVFSGLVLSEEDRLRKWVIDQLMCTFSLDKEAFFSRFSLPFDTYFSKEKELLSELIDKELVIDDKDKITVTPLGELFIRNIASVFDAYLPHKQTKQFSSSI